MELSDRHWGSSVIVSACRYYQKKRRRIYCLHIDEIAVAATISHEILAARPSAHSQYHCSASSVTLDTRKHVHGHQNHLVSTIAHVRTTYSSLCSSFGTSQASCRMKEEKDAFCSLQLDSEW